MHLIALRFLPETAALQNRGPIFRASILRHFRSDPGTMLGAIFFEAQFKFEVSMTSIEYYRVLYIFNTKYIPNTFHYFQYCHKYYLDS